MVVILNASASSAARDPSDTRSKVSALFGAAGAYPRIIVGEGRDVQAIARQAVAADERTIVAGGGDGRHLFSSVTTNTR
jgi:diacylglycerol kinase family enzyme